MIARKRLVVAGVVVLTLVGAVYSTAHIQRYRERPYLHDNLYLPSGKFIQQASLGYDQLSADLVWFQAVQYYGGYRKGDHDLAYFSALIDIVNDLDPHFIFPYRFGAVIMAEDMGALDEAVALLKKGMARNPGSWELPFEIGFLSYIVAGDNVTAGRYFELASKLPGGSDRAGRFAAFVYSRAGHDENSVRMWEWIRQHSEEPYMRDLAERYLRKLGPQVHHNSSHDS